MELGLLALRRPRRRSLPGAPSSPRGPGAAGVGPPRGRPGPGGTCCPGRRARHLSIARARGAGPRARVEGTLAVASPASPGRPAPAFVFLPSGAAILGEGGSLEVAGSLRDF